MTLTLDIPKDLERRLALEASRLGLPIERYALKLLDEVPRAEGRPQTGAELVSSWRREGLVGSRPEIKDSQAHARALRSRAERRSQTRRTSEPPSRPSPRREADA